MDLRIVPMVAVVSKKLEITRKNGTIFVFLTLQMNGELRYAIARKTTAVHFLSKTTKFLWKI